MTELRVSAAKELLKRRSIRRSLMDWGRYKGFEPAPHHQLICREIDAFLQGDDEVLLLFAARGTRWYASSVANLLSRANKLAEAL
jgi:hypothetical protein